MIFLRERGSSVVYDYGTTKKSEKESFKKDIKLLFESKDMDILFISHSEINIWRIKELMVGRKIKRVFIPQMLH